MSSRTTCDDHTEPTVAPNNYAAWHVWAEKTSKTHKQKRCGECGLFKIWVKR